MPATPADFEVALKIIGAVVGLVVLVLGAGRAWGVLTTKLDNVAEGTKGTVAAVAEVDRKMSGLHDRFEGFKQEVRADMVRLAVADSRLEGRVEVVERLQGLPPPWKRTQPILIEGDQG
jgi:hypothetical protein